MKDSDRHHRDKSIQHTFWERFATAAEHELGISRDEKGFMKGIKESLRLRTYSTAQRWFLGYMPRIPYLVRIYEAWGVTPNELLGIEDGASKGAGKSVRRTKPS